MKFSQFYTDNHIGDRLVNSLKSERPEKAFDLGFGSGSLLKSAKKRWSSIKLVGVDIDPQNIVLAKKENLIDSLELDGFSADLPDIILDKYGCIDILISNPPFFQKKLDNECLEIIKLAGLSNCVSRTNKTIPAELVFLAQNLRLLSDDSEIGIILPAGLVSGERWKKLRTILFNSYSVTNVIQIPHKSFNKTEAQTFILTISNSNQTFKNNVNISHLNSPEVLEISIQDAITRADYSYYSNKARDIHKKELSLNDFEIFRGNLSKIALKSLNCSYIHTTDIDEVACEKKVVNEPYTGAKNCMTGDILVSRVGSRCIGRSVYISKGSVPISDCVIAIRAKNKRIRDKIWTQVKSEEGMDFFRKSSLGVGSKYLTHKILQDFIINRVV